MARIFDINAELEAAAAAAAVKRPRGVRPDVPVPFGNMIQGPASFGPTVAPFISEFQVLGLPAANRAVNLISNGVAAMSPLEVRAPNGIDVIEPNPPVCERPNATIGCFAFWHQAVAQWLMRGNFLGINADFDSNGYARQVVPVPISISYAVYERGLPVYYIGGVRYEAYEVTHVPNFLVPGSPWGIGAVAQFRRAISQQLDQQHMAADIYRRGSVPSVVLTTDRPRQDDDQAAEVKSDWIAAMGQGQKVPAVLPAGWTMEKLEWSPEDLEFLQSREFSIAEMALMFNLDPSDLGSAFASASGVQTYANIEQRQIGRVTDTYQAPMRRFEEAWSDLIPGANKARFCPDNAMRLDAETRAKVHQLNIVTQVETVDEARAIEGKKALPKSEVVVPSDPFESPKQEGVADVANPAFDKSDDITAPAPAPTGAPVPKPAPATRSVVAPCPLCGFTVASHVDGRCPA